MTRPFSILTILLFIAFSSCEDEIIEPVITESEDVIQVDSELYDLMQRVAGTTESESEITCIDFVYPFTVFTYDADLVFLSSQQINGDAEFSELLGSLENEQSISISLPIVSILDGGQSVNISSYEELKEVIDQCMDDDFLLYCNSTLPNDECVWRVVENGEYTGGYFGINEDGSVTFYENAQSFIGTWVVIIIDDEVHLNINLEGNSETAVVWNHDWLITLTIDGNFMLNNGEDTVILELSCEDNGCTDLVFQECEETPGSGIADFQLNDYEACILSQVNIEDPNAVTLTFHLTQADADANTNAISGGYTNTLPVETLFVRIEDNASGEATYVSITLEAVSC